MYDCPNCGGNLRFDISLQKLHCDYCGTDLDPYSYDEAQLERILRPYRIAKEYGCKFYFGIVII